jgi:hypothetical protein
LVAAAASAAPRPVLWHDPGPVERLDLRNGPGGPGLRPRAPFTYLGKEKGGSTEKVKVRDAAGRRWVVKFGDEARADTFASRMAWALGYYTEVNYFVPRGVIRGYGRFDGGRFQLRSASPRFLKVVSWSWENNPFVGSRELNGLKVLVMLLGNWDNKDSRDHWRGPNTAVFEDAGRHLYFIDDWGASMGRAATIFTRSKWDAEDFAKQSRHFVRIDDRELDWRYHGAHTGSVADDIRIADVRWLLRYLGRLSDAQLQTALLASGATRPESRAYTRALRLRIRQLQQISRR